MPADAFLLHAEISFDGAHLGPHANSLTAGSTVLNAPRLGFEMFAEAGWGVVYIQLVLGGWRDNGQDNVSRAEN